MLTSYSLTPLSIIHKKFCYDNEASLRKAIVLPLISADTSSLREEDRKVEGELDRNEGDWWAGERGRKKRKITGGDLLKHTSMHENVCM